MFKTKKRYFKAFDKDFKCRGVQFEVGKVQSAEDTSKPCKVQSNTAIHFVEDLRSLPSDYRSNGTSRYGIIEPIGEVVSEQYSANKGSHHIKVVREISKKTLDRYISFVRYIQRNEDVFRNHKLDLIKLLQTRHPELILCGSAAVFLHTGKVYQRNKNSSIHDLDFVTPYYIRIEGDSEADLNKVYDKLNEEDGFDQDGIGRAKEGVIKVSNRDKWGSGNDFDECVYVNDVPCDLAVNPHQKYEYITFRGFRFKVATLASILEAKLRYATQGAQKHNQDIMDLITIKDTITIK